MSVQQRSSPAQLIHTYALPASPTIATILNPHRCSAIILLDDSDQSDYWADWTHGARSMSLATGLHDVLGKLTIHSLGRNGWLV